MTTAHLSNLAPGRFVLLMSLAFHWYQICPYSMISARIYYTWAFQDWRLTFRTFAEKGCKITFKCPWINLEMTFRWYFDVPFDCPRDMVCISYFWFVFLDSYRLWFPMQHIRWKNKQNTRIRKGPSMHIWYVAMVTKDRNYLILHGTVDFRYGLSINGHKWHINKNETKFKLPSSSGIILHPVF